jgi:hypothetical protein
MTFASWMFIWVSAFCMRWMQVLTACRGLSRFLVGSPARTQQLQICRRQAGPSSDSGQHPWSNFLVVVEGEHEVRPAVTRERSVRSRLWLDAPADAEKGCQNALRVIAERLENDEAPPDLLNVTFNAA